MTNRYSDDDARDEVALQQADETPAIGGFAQGSQSLVYVKGSISRVINADPDVFFELLSIVAKRIVALCSTIERCISEINSRLPASDGPDSVLNEGLLQEVLLDIRRMRDGSYAERARVLLDVKAKNALLVESLTYTGGGDFFTGNKDGSEIRRELAAYTGRLLTNYAALVSLFDRFKNAKSSYLSAKLYNFAVAAQADAVVARGVLFLGNSGVSVARATLAASVGIALLEERMTLRNWRTDKYVGPVNVLPGTPAHSTSAISLPVALSVPTTDVITIDGDSGTLEIAASLPATFIVPIERYYSSGSGIEDRFSTSWPNPAGDVTFKLLRDNTPITVTVLGAAWASVVDMAAALDAELLPQGVAVSASGDRLVFSRVDASGFGSKARIAFFDTSGGANDLNATFGLTGLLGESYGVDTDLSGVSTAALSPAPGLTVDTAQVYSGNSAPALLGGYTLLDVDVDHTIEVGDLVVVGPNNYHVIEIFADKVKLDAEILYSFDGVALDTVGAVDFVVLRRRLLLTSTSTSFGETSVVVASPNTLDFPVLADSPAGVHSTFSLSNSLPLGATLRAGDYLVNSAGTSFGRIRSLLTDGIVASLSVNTFPTGDVRVRSCGEVNYRVIESLLPELTTTIAETVPMEELSAKISLYVGGGQNLGLAVDALAAVLSTTTQIKAAFASYSANSTDSLRRLLAYLKENRMEVVHDLLCECAFFEISELSTDDLSDVGAIRYYSGVVSSGVGGADQLIVLSPETEDDTYTQGDRLKDTLPDMSELARGE